MGVHRAAQPSTGDFTAVHTCISQASQGVTVLRMWRQSSLWNELIYWASNRLVRMLVPIFFSLGMSRPISVPYHGSLVYDVVNNLPTEPLIAVFGHARRLAGGGAGDVEPLVDAGVDRSGRLVLALGDVERASVGAVGRVRDSGVGATNLSVGCHLAVGNPLRTG